MEFLQNSGKSLKILSNSTEFTYQSIALYIINSVIHFFSLASTITTICCHFDEFVKRKIVMAIVVIYMLIDILKLFDMFRPVVFIDMIVKIFTIPGITKKKRDIVALQQNDTLI